VISWTFLKFIEPGKYEEHFELEEEDGSTADNHQDRVAETCIWIDVNIDGVQLFKNSSRSQVPYIHIYVLNVIKVMRNNKSKYFQAVPILMRIYGIGSSEELLPKHVIPMDLTDPIIVAFFHGESKPDLDKFLKDFLEELQSLHPRRGREVDGQHTRSLSVRLRCNICDTKERCFLKGNIVII
jgi:hypothetical protein